MSWINLGEVTYLVAYADAIAAATALRFGVPLMTGDPELLVEPKTTTGIASWHWIDLR